MEFRSFCLSRSSYGDFSIFGEDVFIMRNMNLVILIEAASLAAFALVLDLLPSIKITPFVSISFAMVPILILAFRRGFKAGVLGGLLWGLLQIITGDFYFLTVIQFLIEYFIAFACIGFAGLFNRNIQLSVSQGRYKRMSLLVLAGVLAGSLARYFWHFLAGIIFWGYAAPENMSPAIYSLVVNGGSMIGSALLCFAVLLLLMKGSSRLVLPAGKITQERK